MNEEIKVRRMKPGEETGVCDLVQCVFNDHIAPHYAQEGIAEFLKYAQSDALLRRLQKKHFVLLATDQGRIVGMIEVRNDNHVSLLFVEPSFQQQGIGRKLLKRALTICCKHNPDLSKVTVNASPNSVQIYKALGFRPTRSEQISHGIRFTPMMLQLSARAEHKT